MSRLALTPTNVPVSATAITTPTLRAGDMYYNTTTGLMIYDGANWQQVSSTSAVSEVDGGVFDGIAPYNGGTPSTTFTQILNGGTP